MTLVTEIPGYLAGTWDIDPVHSDISFSVRHMMVSKVKGRFATFTGTIITSDSITDSSVVASIDANSIDTRNEQRDAHVRSKDFFDVESYPEWTFVSTEIDADDGFRLIGDLTIKGVTKAVVLALEFGGFGPDVYGGTRVGFSAATSISRKDFGVDITLPMDSGGVMVGDKVDIALEIEAVLRAE